MTPMKTEPICAWCHPGTPGSHTICPKCRAELLASYRGEVNAADVAGTYRELERAARIDNARLDRLNSITTESGLMAARGLAIGFLGGLLILGSAWLAMLAL